MGSFIKNWRTWGPPAFVTLFAPWQDKLTKLNLISEWFQPTLSIFASIVGPLCCMIVYGHLAKQPLAKAKSWSVRALSWFVAAFLLCIGLKESVGDVWLPGETGTVIIRLVWVAVYISLYASLAMALIAGFVAVRPARGS